MTLSVLFLKQGKKKQSVDSDRDAVGISDGVEPGLKPPRWKNEHVTLFPQRFLLFLDVGSSVRTIAVWPACCFLAFALTVTVNVSLQKRDRCRKTGLNEKKAVMVLYKTLSL